MRIARLISVFFLVSYANWASAGVVIDINESGSDVIADFSGSIDLNAVQASGTRDSGSGIIPNLGVIAYTGSGASYNLNLISSDGAWGSGSTTFASSVSGDGLYFYALASLLYLPTNYVSASNIAGSMTFLTQNLTAMGLNTGVYNYTFGQVGAATDFITVNIGEGQIPTPATALLLGLGLGALGFRRRKRA